MNSTFKLTIQTPEKEVFSAEVDSLYLTTETGDMMIFPDHSSFSGSITFSPLMIKIGDHEEEYTATRGLIFFSNIKNETHILCQRCELKGKMDYNSLSGYLKKVQEALENKDSLSDLHLKFLEGEQLALVQEMDEKDV